MPTLFIYKLDIVLLYAFYANHMFLEVNLLHILLFGLFRKFWFKI